jgi:hypothetical protein
MARNGAWRSIVIDQTPAQWPEFFAQQVIAPLWERATEVFLDTLDSYRLAALRKRRRDGLVTSSRPCTAAFPASS